MDDISGCVIPAIEKEYLVRYQQLGNSYIKLCKYFQKRGANLIQVILKTSERKLLNNLKNKLNNLNLIVGGSINNKDEARELLGLGASFVVVERLFITKPENIALFVKNFNEKLVCSVPDMSGYLTPDKKVKTRSYLKLVMHSGVHNIIYVDDATKLKGGVDIKKFREIRSITNGSNLVYSGGIRNLKDISNLKEAGADSVIVGTALHNGSIDFTEASTLFKS